MITEQEKYISNKNYINKDFAQIYPELLDLVSELTTKWDPSTSNESDPGVVLLKLAAFVGDKLNYNIDKNTLECFMPSATQETSMRKLCEMNGYNIGYYNSAYVNIRFNYTVANEFNTDTNEKIVIPKYTPITNKDKEIIYTTLEDVELSKAVDDVNSLNKTIQAIQGAVKDFTVDGVSKIQLYHLDDNNRLYFPETMIAENGIFITSGEDDVFEKVNNLNTSPVGSFVFKFGFDSNKNLPYIEFPDYLNSIIGSGLTIKYTITQGESGNIPAKYLSEFADSDKLDNFIKNSNNETTTNLVMGHLKIINESASINGRNPENLNEAYSNFKKTIGTFDTLVSCRDYTNYIYNLIVENKNAVSNVYVTDRRTDINYSDEIISYNQLGETVLHPSNDINAYDLCLYPLNPIKSYNSTDYYNSFKPLNDTEYIKAELEDVKNISHNYKEITKDNMYCIKNYYNLDAKIVTHDKVNINEGNSIISNIKNALYKNFNARKVDFGCEIPFDDILTCIENADSRIKNVSLNEPDLTTKIMFKDGTEKTLLSPENNNYVANILTKNILAGRIELFDYYTDFQFNFGEKEGIIYEKLVEVETECSISSSSLKDGYELKENQVIQCIMPSLTTKLNYGATIWYNWTSANNTEVEANSIYQLVEGDKLTFVWTDSNDVKQEKIYEKGTIIVPNIKLVNTSNNDSGVKQQTLKSQTVIPMIGLAARENIEIKELAKVELSQETLGSAQLKCYWIRKNKDNILFNTNDTEVILEENEYFIYTDDSMESLSILGYGTSIKRENSGTVISKINNLTISEINNSGLNTFGNTDWYYYSLSNNDVLTIQQNEIYTFNKGITVKANTTSNLNNSFVDISTGEIEYKNPDENNFIPLPILNIADAKWRIRSLLNLNCGPNLPQTLNAEDKIILTHMATTTDDEENVTEVATKITIDEPVNIKTNVLFQNLNGKINMAVVYQDAEGENQTNYIYSLYEYKNINIVTNKNVVLEDNNIVLNLNNYDLENYKWELNYELPESVENYETLLKIYWNASLNNEASAKYNLTISDSKNYYAESESYGSIDLKPGLNIVKIDPEKTALTLTIREYDKDENVFININEFQDTITIYSPSTIKNYKIDNDYLSTIKNNINKFNTTTSNSFDYLHAPKLNKLIDQEDVTSPEAFWDVNNIANMCTIAQIDVDNSKIAIAKSSKLNK